MKYALIFFACSFLFSSSSYSQDGVSSKPKRTKAEILAQIDAVYKESRIRDSLKISYLKSKGLNEEARNYTDKMKRDSIAFADEKNRETYLYDQEETQKELDKIDEARNKSVSMSISESIPGKRNPKFTYYKVENIPTNLIYRFDTASEGVLLAGKLGEEPKEVCKFNSSNQGSFIMINMTYQGLSTTDYWIVFEYSRL
jgi:hypothetical protein